MRVHIEPKDDFAITRVVNALKLYAPAYIEFVDRNDAELVIMNITGRLERTEREIEKMGVRYAIVQYCLKSTQKEHSSNWASVWENAEIVWSYLDLHELSIQDGLVIAMNFYHAPLGVDSNIFQVRERNAKYLALTTGRHYLTESVREIIKAAERIGADVAHLGDDLGIPEIPCYSGLSDDELVDLYSKCKYVSGLRRVEGFELPAAEGLLCGARPILYDRAHYRKWYDGLAVFIPETHRDQIVEDLVLVFNGEYEPVTQDEIEEAKQRFDWETIVNGFWSRGAF